MCLLCCEDQALQLINVDGDLVPVFTGMQVEDDPDAAGDASPLGAGGLEKLLQPNATVNEVGDVAASTTTTAMMSVGDRFDGTIGSTGTDRDWIQIELTAGESYVFTAWGTGGSSAGIDATELNLYNSLGGLVVAGDDIVPIDPSNPRAFSNLFTQVTYTATTSGTYFLDVGSWQTETGNYSVSASTNVFSAAELALQMTEIGWGLPTMLRHDERTGDTMTVDITGLTADGQQLALWALEAWTNVTGISFTTSGDSPDIVFDDNLTGVFAGPDWYYADTGLIPSASVNVNASWLDTYGTTLDSYSYQIYVHEIGHAFGLYHSGNYNGAAIYGIDNHFLNDSYQMTVMSYFSNRENTNVDASNYRLAGPMLADIYAIQSLYGNPAHVFSGDTVWGRNSNVGGVQGTLLGYLFDGDVVNPSIYGGGMMGMTIYDSGGTDLIDVSGRSNHQYLDLREGRFSSVAGLIGNLGIAIGAVIENGTTGSGNDTLIGNASDNVLTGGAGDDTIDGNAGVDTLVINAARSGATVSDLGGGDYEVVTVDGTDRFTGVEFLQFTDGIVDLATLTDAGSGGTDGTPARDVMLGGEGNDTLNGFGGDDRLDGQDGNDVLNGGDGDDELLGRGGNDAMLGGEGNDTMAASDGSDTLYGGEGHDSMGGGTGDDSLYGEAGADILGAGRGNDRIEAGGGDDIASGGQGNDAVYGGAGNDTLAGGRGVDSVYGGNGNDSMGGGNDNDTMYGGDGDDIIGAGADDDLIYGESDNDFLAGSTGNDTIYGGDGNDKINAGENNDLLYGGSGADRFLFNNLINGENDTIADFEDGVDKLRMSGVGFGSQQNRFNALDILDVSGGTAVSYGGHTILLQGTHSSSLGVDDFIFI